MQDILEQLAAAMGTGRRPVSPGAQAIMDALMRRQSAPMMPMDPQTSPPIEPMEAPPVGAAPDMQGYTEPRGTYQPSPGMMPATPRTEGMADPLILDRVERGMAMQGEDYGTDGFYAKRGMNAMQEHGPGFMDYPSQRATMAIGAGTDPQATQDYYNSLTPGMRQQFMDMKLDNLGQSPSPDQMRERFPPGYEPLDRNRMQDALRGQYNTEPRFDDARARDTSQADEIATDAVVDDAPPPTPEQLAEMGARVGIPKEKLSGLDLNTTEAKNFGYLLRMMEAEAEIRRLEDSNTFGQRLLEMIPGQDIESFFMDPDYRRYMLARENFNEAALRAATGATINSSEMPTQRRNYFPLPNDSAENKDFLRRQRQALMMALAAGSGPASKVIPAFGDNVVPTDGGRNVGDMSDEELLKMLQGGN